MAYAFLPQRRREISRTQLRRWVLYLACVLSVGSGQAKSKQSQSPVTTQPCTFLSAQRNATYVGSEICGGCHEEKYNNIVATSHWQKMMARHSAGAATGCESCHGPGSGHVESAGDKSLIFNFPRDSYRFCNPCGACHDANSLSSTGTTRRF
jgi:hypothetical protein